MLKGFVSGEEKDIKRIPMKGRNLAPTATYSNAQTDTKTYFRPWLQLRKSGTNVYYTSYTDISSAGTYSFAFTVADDIDEIRLIHNGLQRNLYPVDIFGSFAFGDYVLSAAFTGANPSEVGGLELENIMLNLGSTALPYEPYGYQEGWEVRDNQDRLIWGREDEFEGTDSIPIKGYGTPLTSVTIKGNGQQTGTPSPQNIVPFDGTGERTENLFDISEATTGKYIDTNGQEQTSPTGLTSHSGYIQITSGEQYTLSVKKPEITSNTNAAISWFRENKTFISREYVPLGKPAGVYSLTSTAPNNAAFAILNYFEYETAGDIYCMFNSGSTALPYEPYGYKIPLTAASVTTPLYLGEVSTTRRVRKLVLTGEEYWYVWNLQSETLQRFFTTVSTSDASLYSDVGYCSHFPIVNRNDIECGKFSVSGGVYKQPVIVINRTRLATVDVSGFKQYLRDEYSAGHPVVIWYVLATEQTGIVNEPLMKIGDYADTLTTTTPIPTTTGATDVTVDTKIPPSELTIKVHAKKIRYGFKIDKSQENSESAVIYTHDAVTMTPAVMDFTNDRFDYGSWENAWFVKDARPCALKLDGTVAYYLDPNDATKKLDGTASDIYYELLSAEPADWSTQWKQYYTKSGDDYTLNDQTEAPTFATNTYYKLTYNSSFTGNFMVEFPQVWFYRHEDTSYNYIEISNYKLSDDWKCYSHINKDGTLVDRIYLPMFKGVIVNSKLRSLPGQIPQGNTTATDEVNAATALGSRWQIWDHSSVELINDLLTLMSKSIDSQGRFGKGRESGYNSSDTVTYGKLQTGTLVKKGKFHGYSSSYKEVKVFGIEGFWANRWDRLQGMLLVNNVWKIKMTPPYNFTGTDFVTLSNAEVPSENGYISKVQTSEYGSIPASISGGSSTKYFKDYFYKTATSTRVAIRGGNCYNGGHAGFRFVDVNNAASASSWHIGASPVYK